MKNEKKTASCPSARKVALDTLIKSEASGQYSNIALDLALKKTELAQNDRALASALFYGCIEKRITLDYYISRLSSRELKEIDAHTLGALRLGIYQLRYLDRIPDHAAINETVALCPSRTRGFVNAVLRSYTRQRDEIELPSRDDSASRYISVKYSVCEALASKFTEIFGIERTESLLGACDGDNGTTVRANTLKISRDELAGRTGGEITPLSPYGVYVSGQISEIFGFENGSFYVQDEASQLCAIALGAKKGETVIDCCSCPGSKSFGAAIDMGNEGKIYSFDLHKNKLSLVDSMAKRLGIDIISTEARDAREPREDLIGKADRVICDVPCSGFGVLSKKPELRYKDPKASAALPNIQYDILKNSARYLKDGGTLVYSTCTVFPEENEKNVERFLSENKEFSLCPFEAGALKCESGMITLYPDEHKTDGFFIAKLTKKQEKN